MAAPTHLPGVLKLATNMPEMIVLAFAEGRPVQSQYSGDQVMYTLDDGRKLYLPPAVAAEITAAGIGAHEPFELVKREVTVGNRRTLRHEIRPLHNPASADALPAPAPASSASSIAGTATNKVQQHAAAPAASNPMPKPDREKGLAIAAELAAELAKPAQAPDPDGALWACFRKAIDIAAAAKKYANERGMLLEPRFEDVRTIAATMFISARGRA